MAQPGFSISELLAAIAAAKKVYNSFFHAYESAPARIQDLTDTLRYFRDALIDLETILRHYGTFYHGQLSFTRKLEECEAFLQEYSELRPEQPPAPNEMRPTTLQKVRRVWQTTKLAFDDATTSLKDGLSLELEKLTNFFMRFIIKRTIPGTEIVVSGQSPAALSNRTLCSRGSDAENFGKLLRQLQSVRDSYTAELYLAGRTNRDPDFSAIYPVLENAWDLLCHRVGFTGEGIPPLPRGGLLQSSLPVGGMVVASTDRSESLLSDIETPSFDDQSRANDRTGTVTINFAMKTEREIDRKSGRRTGIIQRYSFSLQRYSFSQGPKGPVFTWTDQGSSLILRHYGVVPTGAFPHTLHNAVGNPLGISFLEGERHEISLEKSNVVELHSTALDVEYQFTLERQHQQFQEDLRNKNLLKTFELYHIKSKRSGKYYEAIKQDVKLWRSRDYHRLHSLSFNSNVVEKRHIEFPICWFDGKMDRDRVEATVTLYFVQRITRSLPPDDSKRRWSRLPKFPLRRTKSKETPPTTPATPAPPIASALPHSSQSSLYDIETSSSFSNDHRFAPSDIATDLSFLFFEFSSLNHYKSFIADFEEAYKLDTPSEIFTPPQLGLVREDPGEVHPDHYFS